MHGKGAVFGKSAFSRSQRYQDVRKAENSDFQTFSKHFLAGSPDINGLTPKKLGIVFSGLSPYNGIRFRRLSSTRRKGCDRKAGMSR